MAVQLTEAFANKVKQLQTEGYRHARQDELPDQYRRAVGPYAFLINDQSRIITVHGGDGSIQEIQPGTPAP